MQGGNCDYIFRVSHISNWQQNWIRKCWKMAPLITLVRPRLAQNSFLANQLVKNDKWFKLVAPKKIQDPSTLCGTHVANIKRNYGSNQTFRWKYKVSSHNESSSGKRQRQMNVYVCTWIMNMCVKVCTGAINGLHSFSFYFIRAHITYSFSSFAYLPLSLDSSHLDDNIAFFFYLWRLHKNIFIFEASTMLHIMDLILSAISNSKTRSVHTQHLRVCARDKINVVQYERVSHPWA